MPMLVGNRWERAGRWPSLTAFSFGVANSLIGRFPSLHAWLMAAFEPGQQRRQVAHVRQPVDAVG